MSHTGSVRRYRSDRWFGRRALTDLTSVAIAAVGLLLLWRVRKLPEPALIFAAGVAGLLLR